MASKTSMEKNNIPLEVLELSWNQALPQLVIAQIVFG
jgi:hypothetical protein